MRKINLARFVIVLILYSLTPLLSETDTDLNGIYQLNGSPEEGGRLRLQQDGKFVFRHDYGARILWATGRWKKVGEKIILNTESSLPAPAFELHENHKTESDKVKVTVYGGGRGIPGVHVFFRVNGKAHYAGYTQKKR